MVSLLEKLDPSAEASMRNLIGGAIRTQAIHVAAKLGIADHLALGPKSADDLARLTNTHARTLKRVLRFLVSAGVFIHDSDDRFALNRSAEYLQSAHPRSLRRSAIRAGESLWDVSSKLLAAVETGRTPHDELHGTTFFERIRARGKESDFGSRMSGSTAGLGQFIARLDCVRNAKRIVDVGGGHGALIVPILEKNEHLQGVIFDLPATIETARPVIARSRVSDRCELIGGSFFDEVPTGDVYLLSWILHDWEDDDARRILNACRAAGGADAKLLVAEILLPKRAEVAPQHDVATADPHAMDLQMLLLTGGRERTLDEYTELLQEEGFAVRSTHATGSPRGVSVIETGPRA